MFQCIHCFPICDCNQRSVASLARMEIVCDMLSYHDINALPLNQMYCCGGREFDLKESASKPLTNTQGM